MDRAVDDFDRAIVKINDVAEAILTARVQGDHGREAILHQQLEDAQQAKENAAVRVTTTAREISNEVTRSQQA